MVLAVSVRFDFVDGKGKTSFTKIRVPNGFSIAQYTEFAQGMGQLITDLTQSRITRAGFSVGLDLSSATIKAAPVVFADIAQKVMFGFSTVLAGFRTKMKLPALNESKVTAGSDAINQADPDVAAFVTAMENGVVVTLGTISPTDQRGNDVNNTDYAKELFRKT